VAIFKVKSVSGYRRTTALFNESRGAEQYQATNSSIECRYLRCDSKDLRLTITATFACSKSGRPSFVFSRVCRFLGLRLMVSRLPTTSHETPMGEIFRCPWRDSQCPAIIDLAGIAASPFVVPALSVYCFSLVWSVIQFVSQVFPPSVEKACSKCGESVVTPDQTNRA
jgi:hypothetical protein